GVQPHGAAGDQPSGRDRRGRTAAQRAGGGPTRRRGSAVLARGSDRGGRAVGATPSAGNVTRLGISRRRSPAPNQRSTLSRLGPSHGSASGSSAGCGSL